jgi:serine/threonine-protein kinase PknK
MTDNPNGLTHAEANVLAMVESGHSNQEIAVSLSITVGTTKSHLHRAYEKLGACNRLDAIAKARSRGDLLASVDSLAAQKT